MLIQLLRIQTMKTHYLYLKEGKLILMEYEVERPSEPIKQFRKDEYYDKEYSEFLGDEYKADLEKWKASGKEIPIHADEVKKIEACAAEIIMYGSNGKYDKLVPKEFMSTQGVNLTGKIYTQEINISERSDQFFYVKHAFLKEPYEDEKKLWNEAFEIIYNHNAKHREMERQLKSKFIIKRR